MGLVCDNFRSVVVNVVAVVVVAVVVVGAIQPETILFNVVKREKRNLLPKFAIWVVLSVNFSSHQPTPFSYYFIAVANAYILFNFFLAHPYLSQSILCTRESEEKSRHQPMRRKIIALEQQWRVVAAKKIRTLLAQPCFYLQTHSVQQTRPPGAESRVHTEPTNYINIIPMDTTNPNSINFWTSFLSV